MREKMRKPCLSPKNRAAARSRTDSALPSVEILESRILFSYSSHLIGNHAAATANAYTNYLVQTAHTQSGPQGLSPATLRQAYGLNQISFGTIAGDGSGQTIAIVDAYADPAIVADLHTFDHQFGLPDTTLIQINQRGGAALPGTDPMGAGNSWAVETSLDVEWAHAAAPGAKIVLVSADSDTDVDLSAAVNTARNYPGVSVVSISWGSTETSSDLSRNSMYTTPAGHAGVTFVVASGDNGAYDSGSNVRNVDYPAASPNVLAVGGTNLTVDAAGNYLSESGWGDGAHSALDGGSGGGVSAYQVQPSWQHGIVTQSSTKRALPDVAIDGDPATGVAVVDSFDMPMNPWMKIGGTSLGAPLWSGIVAIANQGRAIAGKAVFNGTQTLNAIYAAPASDYHDITTGSNGYSAGPGFDLVTGRGTPIANQLVPYLANVSASSITTTSGSKKAVPAPKINALKVSASAVSSGSSITLSAVNVQEPGGSISGVSFYRETNGKSGLQIGSDAFIGSGKRTGNNWTLTTSTSGLKPGAYTYYAVATDSPRITSNTVSTSIKVTAPSAKSPTLARKGPVALTRNRLS
ncbi:MAG TPA: S53 family peptidase [Phycisphaerae bacterium]|nr:S53 family peptidase [Phycisphaerae bacterium]